MLKIAYISPIYFANVDISYIHEMRQYCDIHYFPIARPEFKGCAIDCPLVDKSGIYNATDFQQLDILKDWIDLDKTKLIVRLEKKHSHVRNFLLTHQLVKLLKREKFDVIHFTDILSTGELELLRFRKQSVMSVHDPFSHSSIKSKMIEFLRRIMFKNLSHFIVFNREQTQDFINYYHLHEKQVHESALSVYSYLNVYKTQRTEQQKYALFIGRIWSHKGLDYLFPAMKIVHERYPDFKLIVAGGGKYYFDITPYINCGYIDIRNHFISDAEQVSLIAYSECVICPYIDATQSGVVMSAYAFDKPCIVTNVGGLPEMVGNGEYGIIVPPRDVQALADAMCRMIEQPLLRERFEKKIHSTYSAGTKSWSYLAKEIYEKVYKNCVKDEKYS